MTSIRTAHQQRPEARARVADTQREPARRRAGRAVRGAPGDRREPHREARSDADPHQHRPRPRTHDGWERQQHRAEGPGQAAEQRAGRPEPPLPPPFGQHRHEQRGRDLGDAPHGEQQPGALGREAVPLVVGREPGEPPVEHQRRPGLVARHDPRERAAPRQRCADRLRHDGHAPGDRHPDRGREHRGHRPHGQRQRPTSEQRRERDGDGARDGGADHHRDDVAAGRGPRPFGEVLLHHTGDQHPGQPDAEPDDEAAADQRRDRRDPADQAARGDEAHGEPQRPLASDADAERGACERAHRHHEHGPGLHEPGLARREAQLRTHRLQQRRVARERGAQVGGDCEDAQQHHCRADGRPRGRRGRHRRARRRAAVSIRSSDAVSATRTCCAPDGP